MTALEAFGGAFAGVVVTLAACGVLAATAKRRALARMRANAKKKPAAA